MGEQMVFKRYEIKYMLTKGQRELIQNRMRDYMTMDVHGKNTILSLEERQLEQYVKNHVPPKDTQIMRELATTFKNNRETEEITNMLNTVFAGIFEGTTGVAVPQFLGCLLVSLLIGLFFAWVYNRKNTSSQSFAVTLALLPAIVCVVIMMVNGNVGAGVAVAGAFSLVRFRSVPGTAKEIAMLFLAMGAGLITGMGYLGYGVLFALLLSGALVLFSNIKFEGKKRPATKKTVKITIPEDLNYSEVFDDIFEKYTREYEVLSVKTTNMGSMFKLTYHVDMRDVKEEKEMIDELRCRNGNLEISVMKQEENIYEL